MRSKTAQNFINLPLDRVKNSGDKGIIDLAVREIALYSEAGALAAYEIEISSAIQGLLAVRLCGPDGKVATEGPVPRHQLTDLLVRRQDHVYLGDASIRNSDETDDLLVHVDIRGGRRDFWIRRLDLAGALVRVGELDF